MGELGLEELINESSSMGCGPSNFLQNIKKGSHIEINVDANNATVGKSEKSRKTVKLQDAHQTKVHPQKLPLESLTRKKSHISVLLVFKRNNSQCLAFSRAAEKLKYSCCIVCNVRDLDESYRRASPDVVVVDSRPGCGVCPEECSKLIRSLENGRQSVLVAVRSQILTDSDSEKMMQLIEAGFDRQFLENTNPVVCLSELQTLHHSHVHSLSFENKCRMFLEIIDNVSDAIEIMDPNYKIQYVNSSSELLYGLEAEDVEGHSYWEKLVKAPDSKISKWLLDSPQVHSMLVPILRKNGEQIQQVVSFLPILDRSGGLEHLVAVHSSSTHRGKSSELVTTPTNEMKVKARKESVIRLPSMTIEAPITKVINMITTLQDACSDDVSDSLNNILDVLRSSELYAPYFTERVRGDKFTCELVGGLMTRDKDEWNNRRVSLGKRPSYSSDQPLLPKSSFHSVNHSQGALFPEIEELLELEENWDFDIIGLERLTHKKPLFHLAMRTFQRFEVTDFLQVEESILALWLQMIESNYHQTNPYHNSTHAADVMHASAYFLSCEQIKAIFDHIDEVACLIAAVIHDLDHPGKTNSFLVNSNADLAFLYNDLAVLESHHVSLAFRLTLKNEETNIFKNISREDFKLLRQQVIDMVLATEMTKHFEHLNRFVSVVNQASVCESPGCNDALLKLATVENKILVKRMLIKCADVSNPARPLYLCKEWAVRIAKEYCDQTDEEKSRGLPVVMPVFDSKSCNVPKSQTSFVDLFINDMYESWTNFCSLPEMKVILRDNYQFWKDQELCITQDF